MYIEYCSGLTSLAWIAFLWVCIITFNIFWITVFLKRTGKKFERYFSIPCARHALTMHLYYELIVHLRQSCILHSYSWDQDLCTYVHVHATIMCVHNCVYRCMSNQWTTSLGRLNVIQSHPCRLANTRPHKLHWGDVEMHAWGLLSHAQNAVMHTRPTPFCT